MKILIWIVLGVIALFIIFGVIVPMFNDAADELVDEPTAGTVADEPITDPLVVITPANPAPLPGERVELRTVEVQRLVSDRLFLVGPAPNQTILVALSRPLNAGAAEQIVDVDVGDTVSVVGTVQLFPGNPAQWDVTDEQLSTLSQRSLYIEATTITIAETGG